MLFHVIKANSSMGGILEWTLRISVVFISPNIKRSGLNSPLDPNSERFILGDISTLGILKVFNITPMIISTHFDIE